MKFPYTQFEMVLYKTTYRQSLFLSAIGPFQDIEWLCTESARDS